MSKPSPQLTPSGMPESTAVSSSASASWAYAQVATKRRTRRPPRMLLGNISEKSIDNYCLNGEDNAHYATPMGTPKWVTWNFAMSYNASRKWIFQFGVYNILDTQYRTFASGIKQQKCIVFVMKIQGFSKKHCDAVLRLFSKSLSLSNVTCID